MPTLTRTPKPRTESTIQAEIRRWAGTQPDISLWRNNVGVLKDATGRPVQYGLCVGSADLVGLIRVEHKLVIVARFLAIEVKVPNKGATDAQIAWLEHVRQMGGVAGIATCWEEAAALVDRARRWEV